MSVKKKNNIKWVKIAAGIDLPNERVKTVVADKQQVCLVHHKNEFSAIGNKCPHQGGPLGEGQIEDGWVICPWHAYQYDPKTGKAPEGFDDHAKCHNVKVKNNDIYIEIEDKPEILTISNQMVEVMTNWGVKVVFGIVGHSNLGFADAMHKAELKGKLSYYGVRHEGAAAFAASAYAKLTGEPGVCFSIAGPGATNMLTGMWDAHVDNVPLLAITGQVNTQIMGPGTFQELDLHSAFKAVTRWQQTVMGAKNASDLMALAIKNAIVEHGPTALILPDEIQQLPALNPFPEIPKQGRIANNKIAPPQEELDKAIKLIEKAKRPCIVVGKGAINNHRDAVIKFAEKLQIPIVTTFKAKGLIPDSHPLACGVLGRSGIPVASIMMGTADLLIVLGASFSIHTGIAEYISTIQVDHDEMALGKFNAVDVPLLGDVGVTLKQIIDSERLESKSNSKIVEEITTRWKNWRKEKARRRKDKSEKGLNSANIFDVMSKTVPNDAIVCVDVGNNTYSFGRYFESANQTILMSGYLGSIGFAFPAAMGAWSANTGRRIIALAGDGGFGQYMAEFTTAVKYNMPILLILLNNSELGKITKEFNADGMEAWHTSLKNPNFVEYAKSCGGDGIRVANEKNLKEAIKIGLSSDMPFIVECITDVSLI
ncbi:MAG: Rieske 2Fe-2S domain-containing protein [Planctomycetia bacterium]|nr:Rieske 2Fe-2S domain-containing protein [Planctomycetia bacterium]